MKNKIKKIRIVLCLVMASLVLAASFSTFSATKALPPKLKASPYKESDFSGKDVTIKTEHQVYAKDIPSIYYTIACLAKEVTFGEPFSVEVQKSGKWYVVPMKSDIWISIAYMLQKNGTRTSSFALADFNYTWTDGNYRLVKLVNGKPYRAPFKIGKSNITAATPFGIVPLERLPKKYTPEQARKDGAYVMTNKTTYNKDKLATFVDKVKQYMPCMLRTVSTTIEGDPIITDFIFDKKQPNGTMFFTVRTDATRDKFGSGKITEEVYSFMSLVTENKNTKLCVSNYVSHSSNAPKDSAYALICPIGNDDKALVKNVDAYIKKMLESNQTTYRVISPDAKSEVSFWPGNIAVSHYDASGSWGTSMEVSSIAKGAVKNLTSARWLDNEKFEVTGFEKTGAKFTGLFQLKGFGFELVRSTAK